MAQEKQKKQQKMKTGNCYLCKERHFGTPLIEVSFEVFLCKFCKESATIGDVLKIVKPSKKISFSKTINKIINNADRLDNNTSDKKIRGTEEKIGCENSDKTDKNMTAISVFYKINIKTQRCFIVEPDTLLTKQITRVTII